MQRIFPWDYTAPPACHLCPRSLVLQKWRERGPGDEPYPLLFFLANSRFSLSLEIPEVSSHFCPIMEGELAQGGNPLPEEKIKCVGGPTNALVCCLHHEILTFPAGFNLEYGSSLMEKRRLLPLLTISTWLKFFVVFPFKLFRTLVRKFEQYHPGYHWEPG